MPRIILGIEYNGAKYCGWQRQPHRNSVQSEIEKALSFVANQAIELTCAGRTDAGVHASEQVAHFDTQVNRHFDAWLLGGNSNLPDDIRILWVKPAFEDFHSRYSALARLYRYVIYNRPVKSALLVNQATWCYKRLDAMAMHEAAQYLLGDHDFTSFRAQGCQSKSPFRIVYFIDVSRHGDKIVIDICANAFLHHMVRNIVGVLMEIGTEKRDPEWTKELLSIKSREFAGVTAPSDGLYLEAIFYPDRYGLVKHSGFAKLPRNIKRFD